MAFSGDSSRRSEHGKRVWSRVKPIRQIFHRESFPECSKRKPYSSNVFASVGSSLTTRKAIIRLVKERGESQVDWPNGCS